LIILINPGEEKSYEAPHYAVFSHLLSLHTLDLHEPILNLFYKFDINASFNGGPFNCFGDEAHEWACLHAWDPLCLHFVHSGQIAYKMKFEAFCGKNFVMYGNAKRSELEF
jgi:hypothetical protein